jgi:hypothetical protein
MAWYWYLYWRLSTWHERWKGPGKLSDVGGLVWLWILHVLNVVTILIGLLIAFPSIRLGALALVGRYGPLGWPLVLLVGGTWWVLMLRTRKRVLEQFGSRGSPGSKRADYAVVSYNVVTAVAFLVAFIASIVDTVHRRGGHH